MAKPFNIREFRSAVAKLKRAGLVHPFVDARSVQPTRPLLNAVKKFQSVVSGQAQTLKLERLAINEREAHRRNIQVAKPAGLPRRIIVPHFKGEKVSRGPGGTIKYTSPEGTRINRLELPPVRTDTIGHFFSDLKRNHVKLPDTRKGERFAAHFYTGRTELYDSLRDLLQKLQTYDAVKMAHGRKNTDDVIRNIEIVTVPKADTKQWQKEKKEDRFNYICLDCSFKTRSRKAAIKHVTETGHKTRPPVRAKR